jgi:hypothetical protein
MAELQIILRKGAFSDGKFTEAMASAVGGSSWTSRNLVELPNDGGEIAKSPALGIRLVGLFGPSVHLSDEVQEKSTTDPGKDALFNYYVEQLK